MDATDRRSFLALAGAGALLAACRKGGEAEKKDEEVGAVEDLMREHGVIRRILVVYRECAPRLRANPSSVAPDQLQRAARLIRSFGEDYHEKKLEEAHIFPALRKADTMNGPLVDVLVAQHERGRAITDYIVTVTSNAIGITQALPLAHALEDFARMYEEHAAAEDTIVFPAWKKTLSKHQLHEMGEEFEDIEKKTFGKDGFDDAVGQVAAIERALGIDLATMLPPVPKT